MFRLNRHACTATYCGGVWAVVRVGFAPGVFEIVRSPMENSLAANWPQNSSLEEFGIALNCI